MTKSPEDNFEALQAYMKAEGISPASHERFMGAKPDNLTASERAELWRNVQRLAHAPKVRDSVTSLVGNTADPKENMNAGLAYFNARIEKDSIFREAVTSISMVCCLLQQHYRFPTNSVLKNANFDEENLESLLQALFSLLKDESVATKRIGAYLRHPDRSIDELLYMDILGLSEDSGHKEIDDSITKFKEAADWFDQLLQYSYVDNVIQAIAEFDPDLEDEEADEDEELVLNAAQIVEKLGIKNNEPFLFDTENITAINEKLKGESEKKKDSTNSKNNPSATTSTPTPAVSAPAANPEINFESFYMEVYQTPATSRIYNMLHNLHFALRRTDEQYKAKNKAAHFNNDDRDTVIGNLDEKLGAD
ncbi:hypothetical protein KJ657_02635, partial [Patescibacteria group bacterium]|nr:hypothetical protein [Patescibacteria group bacterium]